MINTHWPEPITIYNDEFGFFYIQEIADAGDDGDLDFTELGDSEGYSINNRTATRLQDTYNACKGLNIQHDTKLREMLEAVLPLVTIHKDDLIEQDFRLRNNPAYGVPRSDELIRTNTQHMKANDDLLARIRNLLGENHAS